MWPAVAAFAVFLWIELAWEAGDRPRIVAITVIAYSVLVLGDMRRFGARALAAASEFLGVLFAVLGRFAPIAVSADGRLLLRPCGQGFAVVAPADASMIVFVNLAIAGVTFDGLRDTAVWAAVREHLNLPGHAEVMVLDTLGLGATVLLSLGLYHAACALMQHAARLASDGRPAAAHRRPRIAAA